ncbi:hypothetical protein SCANM124S_01484 [Streptomyces canus]
MSEHVTESDGGSLVVAAAVIIRSGRSAHFHQPKADPPNPGSRPPSSRGTDEMPLLR